jgi:hypothetical protein
MEEQEEWRDIMGYEGLYQVSNLARVKRITASFGTPGGILTPHFVNGYPYITLSKGGKIKGYSIHRLVARAFLGEPPEGKPEVNHIDGNRADSRLQNLEWCDHSYNIRDAHRREQLGLRPGNRGDGIKIFDRYNSR